jgi:hypothetical protein
MWSMRDDTAGGTEQTGTEKPGTEQQGDAEAQRHPEGNVPERIESPEVGLSVDDGRPSGEQNAEE